MPKVAASNERVKRNLVIGMDGNIKRSVQHSNSLTRTKVNDT